jgi:hypothetical protein
VLVYVAVARARAVTEARSGRTLSISRPMPTSPILAGPAAPLGADSIAVMQAALFTGPSPRGPAELVMMLTHSPEVTHFDSLVHQVVDGRVYPGIAFEEAGGAAGYRHGSTAVFAQGVVTRGVLVDLAADSPLPVGRRGGSLLGGPGLGQHLAVGPDAPGWRIADRVNAALDGTAEHREMLAPLPSSWVPG